MESWLLTNEASVRIGVFIGLFVLVALIEYLFPRRVLTAHRVGRWFSNISIVVLSNVLARFIMPITTMAMAYLCQQNGWGILNTVSLPHWLEIVLAVVVFDLAIYLQHLMFHAVPILWRLHMVHHADPDVDVTTGTRFHPIEIILSLFIKLVMIYLLGPPLVAVLAFEIILNALAMFNHGNIALPLWLDRLLRLLLVTPDVHRVHHSILAEETNSNFGFNLSIWDRLFGTYCAQPKLGHRKVVLGVTKIKGAESVNLLSLLLIPFRSNPGSYAINRRWSDDES
ncbi:MAG: sterol desaturase family protein [Magnetococcales bacterium]|nr:sterol desaturase family protein [Magnetococcales bacterium]